MSDKEQTPIEITPMQHIEAFITMSKADYSTKVQMDVIDDVLMYFDQATQNETSHLKAIEAKHKEELKEAVIKAYLDNDPYCDELTEVQAEKYYKQNYEKK